MFTNAKINWSLAEKYIAQDRQRYSKLFPTIKKWAQEKKIVVEEQDHLVLYTSEELNELADLLAEKVGKYVLYDGRLLYDGRVLVERQEEYSLIDRLASIYKGICHGDPHEIDGKPVDNLFESFRKIVKTGGGVCISEVCTLRRLLVVDFLPGEPYVLIGPSAVEYVRLGWEGKCSWAHVPIIVSEYEAPQVVEALNVWIQPYTKFKVTYKTGTRSSIYLQSSESRHLLCTLYTNGTHELIPWVNSLRFKRRKVNYESIKLGNWSAQLWFIMLEIKELMEYASIDELHKAAVLIHDGEWGFKNKIGGPNYIGIYEDPQIAMKDALVPKKPYKPVKKLN
jgi:hypothetical protein